MTGNFTGLSNNNILIANTTTIPTSIGTPTADNIKVNWFINLSSSPLTQAQESLLAKGPNFAIVHKYSP